MTNTIINKITTKSQIANMNVKELKSTAKEQGLKGYSKLIKDELIELLINHFGLLDEEDLIAKQVIDEVKAEKEIINEVSEANEIINKSDVNINTNIDNDEFLNVVFDGKITDIIANVKRAYGHVEQVSSIDKNSGTKAYEYLKDVLNTNLRVLNDMAYGSRNKKIKSDYTKGLNMLKMLINGLDNKMKRVIVG